MTFVKLKKLVDQQKKLTAQNHKANIRILKILEEELFLACPQSQEPTYYPDPSGNNDSHFQCKQCGCFFDSEHPKRS